MTHFSKLSDVKVKALKPVEKAYKVFDGQGLFLEVMPNGNKKWRFRYLYKGQDKRITLGTYPTLSLKEARSKAENNLRLLTDQKYPLQERHREETKKTELTFLDVAKEWEEQFLVQMQPATIKKKRMQLQCHVYPHIGEIFIKDITPFMILERVLRPILAKN